VARNSGEIEIVCWRYQWDLSQSHWTYMASNKTVSWASAASQNSNTWSCWWDLIFL